MTGTRFLLIALLIGVTARLAVIFAVPVFPVVANTWDSVFYDETATSLSEGRGFVFQGRPTAFYPPGFPLFTAFAYEVMGPEPRSGQLFNFLASLILLACCAWGAGEALGPRAGRAVASVLALEPSQIVMPAFLMSEVLCGATIAVLVAALFRWSRRGGFLWLVLAAASAAAAGMTRGHAFLLVPAVFFGLAWCRERRPRDLVLGAVICGVAVTATLGAWSQRNRQQLGHPVLIATNAGLNLLLGNNPNAWGGRADPPGGVPNTVDEVENERLAREQAWTFVRENPGRVLLTIPLKALRLWGFGPAVTYRSELRAKLGELGGIVLTLAAQISHLLLLAGAVVGAGSLRRASRPGRVWFWVVASCLAVWTLGHLPFVGGARYLFPVHPLLATLAVTGLLSARGVVGTGATEAAAPGHRTGA